MVASWEHLEHIPTIKLTFVQETFVLVTFVYIRNISSITNPILMKLQRYLHGKTSRTDCNHQVGIRAVNICPGNICSYQEYLS